MVGSARESGQSLAELALVLPVLLLLVLIAVDFGRIYLGYINLQQMSRVGASYAAEHAKAWAPPVDTTVIGRYQEMIRNDASVINCQLPVDGSGNPTVPDPVFPAGFDIGDPAEVRISCAFSPLTPLISSIFGGGQILVGATTVYPVKEGIVATVPGGGGPVIPAPVADFIGSPLTGYAPLSVTLIDQSANGPTSWQWNFGNGTAFTKGPHTRTYDCTGAPGDTCTYTVQLTVGNVGGFDTRTRSAYIVVTVPPASGPVAEFTATPQFGSEPLTVNFEFVDNGAVTYTAWEWDFNGDGATDATGPSVTRTYATAGTYDVTLTVTDSSGATDSQTKTQIVVVSEVVCTVPDFANVRKNDAQALWSAAGFTTTVNFEPGPGNYKIQTQTLTGGTIDPQPDGCDSQITVGP